MKLKEYVENLTKLLNDRPETAEFDVLTSIDDEGNGFNLVDCLPSVGTYTDGEFQDENKPNAICVN